MHWDRYSPSASYLGWGINQCDSPFPPFHVRHCNSPKISLSADENTWRHTGTDAASSWDYWEYRNSEDYVNPTKQIKNSSKALKEKQGWLRGTTLIPSDALWIFKIKDSSKALRETGMTVWNNPHPLRRPLNRQRGMLVVTLASVPFSLVGSVPVWHSRGHGFEPSRGCDTTQAVS